MNVDAGSIQLLDLNKYVHLEILKYLVDIDDMKNVSLTCKAGFEMTKEFFESKTLLKFTRRLTLKFFLEVSNFKRSYKNVAVFLETEFKDIILQQLSYLKLKVTEVHILGESIRMSSKITHLSDIRREVDTLKSNFKTIQKVYIYLKDLETLHNLDDIQKFEDCKIPPEEIVSSFICFNGSEGFDNEFYNALCSKFINLKDVKITIDVDFSFDYHCNEFLPPNLKKLSKLERMTFISPIGDNILRVFQGLKVVTIDWKLRYIPKAFLKTVIELNKDTLEELNVRGSMNGDIDSNIPCQVRSLQLLTKGDLNKFIENQNHLEYLKVTTDYTSEFFDILKSHCAPILDISNNSSNVPEQIHIPNLPMVRNLTIDFVDIVNLLQKTKNVEILTIKETKSRDFKDSEKYHQVKKLDLNKIELINPMILNGLEFMHLKTLNIEFLNPLNTELFVSLNLQLPNLENLVCSFNKKLFQMYKKIKFLRLVSNCNFSLVDFQQILNMLPQLEELNVPIFCQTYDKNFDKIELIHELNYFEGYNFGNTLKFIHFSSNNNLLESNLLQTIEERSNLKFVSDYNKTELFREILIGFDVQKKIFMYTA